ncbi:MAG: hypothetical protein ABI891_01445 [Acidobacteriota bacterium]
MTKARITPKIIERMKWNNHRRHHRHEGEISRRPIPNPHKVFKRRSFIRE